MSEIKHRSVETNGIRMHIAEQGAGPLLVLCHGFPESWYSWRHQLRALADTGFHVVAPDMRGYGQTDRPEAIDQYTLLHLVGDMVGLLDSLVRPFPGRSGHGTHTRASMVRIPMVRPVRLQKSQTVKHLASPRFGIPFA